MFPLPPRVCGVWYTVLRGYHENKIVGNYTDFLSAQKVPDSGFPKKTIFKIGIFIILIPCRYCGIIYNRCAWYEGPGPPRRGDRGRIPG
jgi:hypothetical protein